MHTRTHTQTDRRALVCHKMQKCCVSSVRESGGRAAGRSLYLKPPHVSRVSCIFQTVLVALEEKLEEESVETQREREREKERGREVGREREDKATPGVNICTQAKRCVNWSSASDCQLPAQIEKLIFHTVRQPKSISLWIFSSSPSP